VTHRERNADVHPTEMVDESRKSSVGDDIKTQTCSLSTPVIPKPLEEDPDRSATSVIWSPTVSSP
jgi:hypothetical protein